MATPAFLKEVDHCDACCATEAPTTTKDPAPTPTATTTKDPAPTPTATTTKAPAPTPTTTTTKAPAVYTDPTTTTTTTTASTTTAAGPTITTVADPCADCDCSDSASQQHILSIAALVGAVLVSFVF